MVTWNDATPPVPPPLTAAEKARGAARVAAIGLLTLAALILFWIGRTLKRLVWKGVTFHYFVARIWARAMLWLIGTRPRVTGEAMTGGGVIVANHSTWADILALRHTRLINFVSKADVRAWPAVGSIAEICDTVFIERRRTAAAVQRTELGERIDRGQLLCIFPEGTSSDGLRVLPFKSTLLAALFEERVRASARIQPVTLNWIPPEGMDAAFYGWWGTMPFEGNIWQICCRSVGGAVELVFHEARPVRDFADRKEMTRWAEAEVRAAKRIPQAAPAASASAVR